MRGSFEDALKKRTTSVEHKKIEPKKVETVVEEKDFESINKILDLSLDKILRMAKNGISSEELASLFEELKSDIKLAEQGLMHTVNEEEYEVHVVENYGQVLYGPAPVEVYASTNFGQVLYGPAPREIYHTGESVIKSR